jgi:TonB family protein
MKPFNTMSHILPGESSKSASNCEAHEPSMTQTRIAALARRAAAVLFCAVLATSGVTAEGQKVDELTALLGKPVSPGTLTLLIPHAKDQRVPERWRRSLWNADARVRAVAARLLHVAGATFTARSLQQVLATESDPAAAYEMARAVLTFGGPAADADVSAAAGRFESGRFGHRVHRDASLETLRDRGTLSEHHQCDSGAARGERREEGHYRGADARGVSGVPRWPAASLSPDSLPSVPVPPIGVVPPKKTRNVHPVYPKHAQSLGRQGIVIVEATISPEGCVNRGELLQGVSFDLDVSAMRAVTGGQFTPTLLNGKPMPVVMTVTVQFSLR